MAARKTSKSKMGGKRGPARKKTAKRSAKRAAKKSPAGKAAGKKTTMKRPAAKKAAPKRKSPIQRVRSVAVQVAQQAQAAVVGGVEVLREAAEKVTENIAERVNASE